MGRILRKKPTSQKKRKKPEADSGVAGSPGPTAAAPAEVATTSAVHNGGGKPRPVVLSKRPQPPPGPTAASPPADNIFTRALQFLREVKIELKKVTWPSRKQTMGSTLVVLVLVILISAFLGIVDIGLSTVIRAVFR